MNICFHCGEETSNPKFCSRSCSVTYNNRKTPKRQRSNVYEPFCIHCGAPRRQDIPGKFCSQTCGHDYRRKQRISEWLSSGVLSRDTFKEDDWVKIWMYEQQSHRCAICGHGREWNGMKLNFIMDHIDGNSENSARDNLRLVCPNCDFQLPTSKGRNAGSGRKARRDRRSSGSLN